MSFALLAVAIADQTYAANALAPMPGGCQVGIRWVVDDCALRAWDSLGKKVDYVQSNLGFGPIGNKVQANPTNTLRVMVSMVFPPNGGDYPRLAFKSSTQKFMRDNSMTLEFAKHKVGAKSRWHAMFVAPFPPGAKASDMQVGFAFDNWKTIGTMKLAAGKPASASGVSFFVSALEATSHAGATARSTMVLTVNMPKEADGKAYRFVAFDKTGKKLTERGYQGHSVQQKFYLDTPYAGVASIQLQVQAYTWVTFRQVAVASKG